MSHEAQWKGWNFASMIFWYNSLFQKNVSYVQLNVNRCRSFIIRSYGAQSAFILTSPNILLMFMTGFVVVQQGRVSLAKKNKTEEIPDMFTEFWAYKYNASIYCSADLVTCINTFNCHLTHKTVILLV